MIRKALVLALCLTAPALAQPAGLEELACRVPASAQGFVAFDMDGRVRMADLLSHRLPGLDLRPRALLVRFASGWLVEVDVRDRPGALRWAKNHPGVALHGQTLCYSESALVLREALAALDHKPVVSSSQGIMARIPIAPYRAWILEQSELVEKERSTFETLLSQVRSLAVTIDPELHTEGMLAIDGDLVPSSGTFVTPERTPAAWNNALLVRGRDLLERAFSVLQAYSGALGGDPRQMLERQLGVRLDHDVWPAFTGEVALSTLPFTAATGYHPSGLISVGVNNPLLARRLLAHWKVSGKRVARLRRGVVYSSPALVYAFTPKVLLIGFGTRALTAVKQALIVSPDNTLAHLPQYTELARDGPQLITYKPLAQILPVLVGFWAGQRHVTVEHLGRLFIAAARLSPACIIATLQVTSGGLRLKGLGTGKLSTILRNLAGITRPSGSKPNTL